MNGIIKPIQVSENLLKVDIFQFFLLLFNACLLFFINFKILGL